jgi:glucose-1-phosphate thymidylyltransferase
MKILIFGNGYLGNRLLQAWPEAVMSKVRIDDKMAVLKALDEHKPDVVVNCAGATGVPNVDWCESHQVETFRSNAIGPMVLAEACQEKNVYLLHLGSGCIFYGPSPDPAGWRETDFANPSAFYSRTKYAADLVLSKLPNVGIARLRMPIDSQPGPRNLINKLANYKQIVDVENSVTVVGDLIQVLHQLIEKKGVGIFHVVNPGTMRHRDLLALYKELVDPNYTCEWIKPEELVTRGLAVKARSNCILQSKRLAELGIQMRPIAVALRDTMERYAQKIMISRKSSVISQDAKALPELTTHDLRLTTHDSRLTTRPRRMKGVILAGGKGTRLAPLTDTTNKHLLPIYNKPMVMYPLQTLLDAGIKDILLITGPDYAHQFMKLLGSGHTLGCHLTYRIQDQAGGIAQALGLAEDYVGNDNCTVILGDNIFEENFFPHISNFREGAMAFYKPVNDPRAYGVMELDQWGNVISIEEKPAEPKSNYAQVGLYVYDPDVFGFIRTLKPSDRGELEITDVNNHYLAVHKLVAKPVRGIWWDAGSFANIQAAGHYFASKALSK